jgi:hypothetical protein
MDDCARGACYPITSRSPRSAWSPHTRLSLPCIRSKQYRAVGNIGRRRHHRVDQLAAAVDLECAFIPKYHWLPFLVLCISGSRALSAFLLDDGALMIIASTTVSTFSPLCGQVLLHRVEQLLAQLVRFEQVAEAAHVASSGTGSRPRSIVPVGAPNQQMMTWWTEASIPNSRYAARSKARPSPDHTHRLMRKW